MLAMRVKTLYKYASVTRTTLHFAVGKKLTSHLNLAFHADVFRAACISSVPTLSVCLFTEIWAPLKTPAWEANLNQNNTDSLSHKFGLHQMQQINNLIHHVVYSRCNIGQNNFQTGSEKQQI